MHKRIARYSVRVIRRAHTYFSSNVSAFLAAAEDNHESMVWNSVMETVVLVVVSVGQIIFVRRWFQGKGTLLKQWS